MFRFKVTSIVLMPILLAATAVFVEDPGCSASSLDSYVEELVRWESIVEVYYSDGAADGSILAVPPQHEPHPAVRPILACVDQAAPVLVERLSDARPTRVLFRTGSRNEILRQASVGHLVLDILLMTVADDSGVLIADCFDDGLGACVNAGYYFEPDAWFLDGNLPQPKPEVLDVKRRWTELLEAGRLNLEYPKWLTEAEKGSG